MLDPDEEITQPAEPKTLLELAKEWQEEFAAVATSERPTLDLKKVKK